LKNVGRREEKRILKNNERNMFDLWNSTNKAKIWLKGYNKKRKIKR
jgi:hypothetical protein